jgi:uncharacterized protein
MSTTGSTWLIPSSIHSLSAALAWVTAAAIVFTSMAGCDDVKKSADPNFENVNISGKAYSLQLANTPEKRVQGLSGRTSITEDGGMLFVFPDSQVRVQEFVMRDCVIPIDIIFLDRSGRVTAKHAMKVEDPRRSDEPKPADPRQPDPYELRLKRYSSKYAAQYVIELAGGQLEKLTVKEGDKIELDLAGLKARAK